MCRGRARAELSANAAVSVGVGGDAAPRQPFEDNPEFRRHRPLSDATKEKIFQAITSNPTENPPRKVAAKFGISLERLDAIVRLKKLEREMVENVRARGTRGRHPRATGAMMVDAWVAWRSVLCVTRAAQGFVVDAELTKSMEEFVSATDVVQRPGDDDASSEDTPYLFPNYLLLQEREPVPADLLAVRRGHRRPRRVSAARSLSPSL